MLTEFEVNPVEQESQQTSTRESKKNIINKSVNLEEWGCLLEWVRCICVVTFDLNLGQVLEFVHPPQLKPQEQEISSICYMAFPDSNSGCMGDTKFHIRLRVLPDAKGSDRFMRIYKTYNSECLQTMRADNSHYWGFVYFRQKRDAGLPRGYLQKSLILLTCLPFFNLFYGLLSQIAERYFDEGTSVLEQCCQQINKEWPRLQTGVTLNLPLFEVNYQVLIPKLSSSKMALVSKMCIPSSQYQIAAPLLTKIITTAHELELFRSLRFFVENIYTLWELVLIAEPIIVVAASPADCSHMVQTLVALISPLEYCGEARPYFTIHDSEFKEFTTESETSHKPLILGVTNPFFIKLLKEWPHMLRVFENQANKQHMYQKNNRDKSSLLSLGNVGFSKSKKNCNGPNTTALSGGSVNDGWPQGLQTKYKPFLKKDKTLIKKLLLGMKTKRPDQVQTALLRRSFLELTQSFMIPLERYIASLMPLQKDISPFKSTPNVNLFKMDDFLATLEHSGPHLTCPLKGDWRGLYKRFFTSVNFRGWYETRHRELQLTLLDLQLQALSEENLENWAQDKQEVEIIDMILQIKQKLNFYTDNYLAKYLVSNSDKYHKLQEQIEEQIKKMKELLPHDLRNVVNI